MVSVVDPAAFTDSSRDPCMMRAVKEHWNKAATEKWEKIQTQTLEQSVVPLASSTDSSAEMSYLTPLRSSVWGSMNVLGELFPLPQLIQVWNSGNRANQT